MLLPRHAFGQRQMTKELTRMITTSQGPVTGASAAVALVLATGHLFQRVSAETGPGDGIGAGRTSRQLFHEVDWVAFELEFLPLGLGELAFLPLESFVVTGCLTAMTARTREERRLGRERRGKESKPRRGRHVQRS